MDRGRNTAGSAQEASHGCTAIYPELDLWPRFHHPRELLGSVPQWKLYHLPMQHYQSLYGTAQYFVWMCSNGAGYYTLVMKDLHSSRLDY